MEELKKWALGVCAAAIFSSVIYALVPKGNMQKIMRCVTALAVICALVFPLASAIMKTNFSVSSPDTEALIPSELNNEVNYRLTAAYAQQMQDGVQEILASYGYLDCEIDLLTDIDEQGSIFIKKGEYHIAGRGSAERSGSRETTKPVGGRSDRYKNREHKLMDIKHFFEKLKSVFTSDKKLAVLCAVGVLGVVLLIISEFIPTGEKKAEKKESVTAAQSQETYAEDIEKRLTEIVSSIDGAGKTRVMVTLESGAEQVYARNEKIKSDTSGGTALEKENFSDEKEYVLIETDGNEGGMIIKLIQPKIRGVAVVCEGGGSDAVRQEITQAITAVLDISASRVYITKMSA